MMAGSNLAPILVPIAGFLGLAIWIFMIFYADSHPAHGRGATPLDSAEYDTGLQGTYLTKPELRVPRQERRQTETRTSADQRAPGQVPGQRQAEPRETEPSR